MSNSPDGLHLLQHPYTRLTPTEGTRPILRDAARTPGSALVWRMGSARTDRMCVEQRPGGLALIVILPEAVDLSQESRLIATVQRCRPQGILPYHEHPHPHDLSQVLRRPPLDLASEVTDYLSWRGLTLDRDTTRLIRRIIELSRELRSITALSRSMYLSRRALGRRLMTRGLPVPSHWLQLGRLLRLAVKLQNSDANLFSLACEAGYPDGFSVSNQMHRLIGYRPTQVREHLGWEWLLEEWLRKEAEAGAFSPTACQTVVAGERAGAHHTRHKPVTRGRPSRSRPGASA